MVMVAGLGDLVQPGFDVALAVQVAY